VAAPTGGEVATLLRSIRRWLLVLVSLVGVSLVALAAVGYEVSGATDGALYAAIGLTGAFVTLLAGLRALLTLFGGPPSATTDGSSPAE
jgi:hypothetical protein